MRSDPFVVDDGRYCHLVYATNAAKIAGTTPQRIPGNPAYLMYNATPNSESADRQAAAMEVGLRNFAPGRIKPNANRI